MTISNIVIHILFNHTLVNHGANVQVWATWNISHSLVSHGANVQVWATWNISMYFVEKCLDTENIKHYYVLLIVMAISNIVIHILFNHTLVSHGANVQVWVTWNISMNCVENV